MVYPLLICRVAPLPTVVEPELKPSAEADEAINVPAFTLIFPAYVVLVPDNVNAPEPAFCRLPEPDKLPDNSSLPESPVVNDFELAMSKFPCPETVLTVSVALTSYVAPD